MPKLGDARVNDTEYEGIVIEQYSYWQTSEPCWAVPAWDERGEPELCGPFATREEAQEALRRQEAMWED